MTNLPPTDSPAKKTPIWLFVIIGACGCGLFGCAILAAILFPVFAQAKLAAQRTACLTNMKQFSTSCLLYANDNNETYPPSATWVDKTDPESHRTANMRCPILIDGEIGYGMNNAVGGKQMGKLHDLPTTLMLFESKDTAKNAHGNPMTDACAPRHRGRSGKAYADGHVTMREAGIP